MTKISKYIWKIFLFFSNFSVGFSDENDDFKLEHFN